MVLNCGTDNVNGFRPSRTVQPPERNREVMVVNSTDAEVSNLDKLEAKLDISGSAQNRPRIKWRCLET